MRTIYELDGWIHAADAEFGDASEPACQIFARWIDPIIDYKGAEIAIGKMDGDFVIRIDTQLFIPLPIDPGTNGHTDREGICIYGIRPVTRDVWYLTPAIRVPRLLHAFVTIHGVPSPPPWDRRAMPVMRDHSALILLKGGAR